MESSRPHCYTVTIGVRGIPPDGLSGRIVNGDTQEELTVSVDAATDAAYTVKVQRKPIGDK